MNNINNLSLGNLTWIRDKAIPASKLKITQESLDVVVRARALILGFPYSPVACFSCSARSEFKVSKSVFEQYEQQILDRITELEVGEINTDKDEDITMGQIFHVVTNSTQEPPENHSISDDIVEEKIVSMESSENEISVTTVKRGRKPKDEK